MLANDSRRSVLLAWTIRRHALISTRLTVFQSLLESGSPQSLS